MSVSLESLAEFQEHVTFPASLVGLSLSFFKETWRYNRFAGPAVVATSVGHCQSGHVATQDRTVLRRGKHLKAFASEMLSAIYVLKLFLVLVVRPTGVLTEHLDCFDELYNMTRLFQSGDAIVGNLPLLNQVLHRHHVGSIFSKASPNASPLSRNLQRTC